MIKDSPYEGELPFEIEAHGKLWKVYDHVDSNFDFEVVDQRGKCGASFDTLLAAPVDAEFPAPLHVIQIMRPLWANRKLGE